MKTQWDMLAAKINALSQRERALVLAAVLVCVVALMNALLLDPIAARSRLLSGKMASDLDQLRLVQQQIQALERTAVVDPDAPNRARLAELQGRLQQVNASLEDMQQQLVSPDRMAGLLEDILKKNGQLKLVSLKTLPMSGVSSSAAADAAGQAPATGAAELPVYRHGVELKVQGRYLDLMNYLQALEKLPWHILWGGVTLTADAYPQSTLTLTIYTLSLDRTWLSI